MKITHSISALLLSTALITPTFADDDQGGNRTCTAAAISAAGAVGADATNTTCIAVRNSVKVIVAMNNGGVNGNLKKKGKIVSQQAVNVRNLARDYENNYDMSHGDEFEVVVVAYAAGVDWLRIDDETKSSADNQAFITNEIIDRGIKIYACQNTMKAKGLMIGQLLPGVETVPAGVSAVIDFQNQGMAYLNP